MQKRKYLIAGISMLVLLAWYVLWSAMQYHGTVPLGKGYRYFYTDSGLYIDCVPSLNEIHERLERIDKRAEREGIEYEGLPKAGPNVDGYRVYRQIITGHVSNGRYTNAFGDPIPKPRPLPHTGYFIIDVRIDRAYDGLSKEEWLKKLRSFGVTSEPKLFKPSIYDELLRRNRPT